MSTFLLSLLNNVYTFEKLQIATSTRYLPTYIQGFDVITFLNIPITSLLQSTRIKSMAQCLLKDDEFLVVGNGAIIVKENFYKIINVGRNTTFLEGLE